MIGTAFKITPSQSLVGKVVGLEEFTGTYGPSYNMDLETGGQHFRVTETKDKINSQLQKAGLNYQTVIGRTIKLWKRPMPDNPTKGYLNIDLMDTGRGAGYDAGPLVPPQGGPLSGAIGRVVGNIAPPQTEPLPAWLDKDAKEGQIKELARADFEWAWHTAWGIMNAKVEDSGSAMGDPLVVQAVQSAAIGLMIRLEHARRG